MGAYNRTNGEPCCASLTLLEKILRQKWGFEGFVVSDCWAIIDIYAHHKIVNTPEEAAALAVKNGCDLNCGSTYPALNKAVAQGLISEAEIDQAVESLADVIVRFTNFSNESRMTVCGAGALLAKLLPAIKKPFGFAGATGTGCVVTTVPGASVTGTVTSCITWISMGCVCPPIITVFGCSAIATDDRRTASNAGA
jgi:hypothetical protein